MPKEAGERQASGKKKVFFFSFLNLTAEQAGKKKRMLELTDHDVLFCRMGHNNNNNNNNNKLYLLFALE